MLEKCWKNLNFCLIKFELFCNILLKYPTEDANIISIGISPKEQKSSNWFKWFKFSLIFHDPLMVQIGSNLNFFGSNLNNLNPMVQIDAIFWSFKFELWKVQIITRFTSPYKWRFKFELFEPIWTFSIRSCPIVECINKSCSLF